MHISIYVSKDQCEHTDLAIRVLEDFSKSLTLIIDEDPSDFRRVKEISSLGVEIETHIRELESLTESQEDLEELPGTEAP